MWHARANRFCRVSSGEFKPRACKWSCDRKPERRWLNSRHMPRWIPQIWTSSSTRIKRLEASDDSLTSCMNVWWTAAHAFSLVEHSKVNQPWQRMRWSSVAPSPLSSSIYDGKALKRATIIRRLHPHSTLPRRKRSWVWRRNREAKRLLGFIYSRLVIYIAAYLSLRPHSALKCLSGGFCPSPYPFHCDNFLTTHDLSIYDLRRLRLALFYVFSFYASSQQPKEISINPTFISNSPETLSAVLCLMNFSVESEV